ncbi:MAG: hypothetical protein GX605_09815, partial [Chloroflexi bacterium]|nr:hypothetical protein [Chloroflexota bacterium]
MAEQNQQHCPYLGLQGDRNTFFIYPTPLHRCYRPVQPVAIHPDDQDYFCLQSHWHECPRIVGPASAEMRASQDAADELAPPAPEQAWETWETMPPARPSAANWKRRLLVLGALLIFLCPSVLLLRQNPEFNAFLGRVYGLVGMAPTATPTATKTPLRIGVVAPTDTPTP